MKLSELFGRAELAYPSELGGIEIKNITTDSRRVSVGSLFICMKGERSDGHEFVVEAIQSGASVIVAEQVRDVCVGGAAAYIMLKNTRNAAALLYNAWYGDPVSRLKIIGVTGTNGKTSVSYLLCELFEAWGKRCGVIGTVECRSSGGRRLSREGSDPLANMTTPDPEVLYRMLAEMMADGVEYVMMEVSSHALALSRVDAIRFRWAVFTNLTQDHLDFHGTMEAYFQAKRRLFTMCDRGVLFIDDPYIRRLAEEMTIPFFTCSAEKGDFCALDRESFGMEGTSFTLKALKGTYPMHLAIPGEFSVINGMLSAAVAIGEGIPPEIIASVFRSTSGVPGRMERVFATENEKPFDFSAVIDYAHTPDALEKILKALLPLRGSGGRLLLLFGCGGERDRGKRRRMGRIASAYADLVIVTSDNCRGEPRERILRDVLRGIDKEKPHLVIADRRNAIEAAVALARRGDILLLAGKGHERYEIYEDKRIPFDERQILRDAWRAENSRRNTKKETEQSEKCSGGK
ncbi:MAG: UDP-N-acetylmuramoyl-L-alanyl-D-glutamate--2,6-diaminopimelate ligase, partial [Clostridia bacterium]|nr:UDP-N-acetylmuramoyl-L-alanyl-D-glutamate--2,6-diaminopimelate ligase [Clostridia bacterium]